MNRLQNRWRQSILLLALLATCAMVRAQDTKKNIAAKVANKQFVFKAQTVTPASGRLRQLTSEYDLKVSGDSVIAYLPYFGRAYSAPLDPSDAGIKFTSVSSDYKYNPRKKGWDLAIKPKDVSGIQDLSLTIFDNGSASLRVTSTNRQPISFNGYIQK